MCHIKTSIVIECLAHIKKHSSRPRKPCCLLLFCLFLCLVLFVPFYLLSFVFLCVVVFSCIVYILFHIFLLWFATNECSLDHWWPYIRSPPFFYYYRTDIHLIFKPFLEVCFWPQIEWLNVESTLSHLSRPLSKYCLLLSFRCCHHLACSKLFIC